MASYGLGVGKMLKGRQHNYDVIKKLPGGWSAATHFQANVLDGKTRLASGLAIIKTAPPRLRTSLLTEIAMYSKPNMRNSQYIRPMLDIITEHDYGLSNPPSYLALVWMDRDLSHIDLKQYAKNPAVLNSILTQILQGLVAFEAAGHVHSNIKHANILFNSPRPGVYNIKLADLGCSTLNGFAGKPPGNLATRAPEIYEFKGYHHHSDVWAVGLTLLEYFKAYTLENMLPDGDHIFEEAMIAKLMLLYPTWPHGLLNRNHGWPVYLSKS